MINSKLIKLLQALPRKDFLEFGRYLHCGFFTKDIHVIKLYEYLKKRSKTWDSHQLEKILVAKKISTTDHQYTVDRINHISSDLYLQLENYLSWKQIKQSRLFKQKMILEALKKLRLDEPFLKYSTRLEENLKKQLKEGSEYYLQKMLIHHERYNSPFQLSYEENVQDLKKAYYYLELHHLDLSIAYYIEILTRKRIFTNENISPFATLSNLLEKLAQPPFLEIPSLQIKRYLLLLLSNDDKETFFILKSLVMKHINKMASSDQLFIINTMINFTIRHSVYDRSFIDEKIALYNFGIQNGYLLDNNHLNHLHFLNLVDSYITIRKYDMANKFISNHSKSLLTKYKANTLNLANAQILFAENQLEKALPLFLIINFDSLTYTIITKSRLIQCYFELIISGKTSYEPSLKALFNSYYKLLKTREDQTQYVVRKNLNFVLLTKKIFSAYKKNTSTVAQLQYQLDEYKDIAYRHWLQDIINGLEK